MNKNNLEKNLIYKIIHQIIIFIFPIILTPYVSRVLGATGVGIYSYYYSISLYFTYFAMLGINVYGNRSIAKVKDDITLKNKVFTNIYILQFLMNIIIIIIYFIFISFSNNKIICSIMIINIFTTLFDVNWLYFGEEKFKKPIIYQIICRLLMTILIFIFVKNRNDLWIYAIFKCSGDLIANVIIFIFAIKNIKYKDVSLIKIKKNFKSSLILFIPAIAASIYQQMDKIMLGIFINKTTVGYYESSTKIVTISLGIITSILAVISPKMSNLISKKKNKEAFNLFNSSMEYILCLGVAICFGIMAISKEFIPLFFGKGYDYSIKLTMILSISVIFLSWSNTLKFLYIIPKEKDSIYVKSVIYGAIANIIINLLLIPKLSAVGAALGTILAEFVVLLYQSLALKKEIALKEYLKKLIIYILFGIIMFFVVRLVSRINITNIIKVFLEIILGGSVYILLLLLFYYIKNNNTFINKKIKIMYTNKK